MWLTVLYALMSVRMKIMYLSCRQIMTKQSVHLEVTKVHSGPVELVSIHSDRLVIDEDHWERVQVEPRAFWTNCPRCQID